MGALWPLPRLEQTVWRHPDTIQAPRRDLRGASPPGPGRAWNGAPGRGRPSRSLAGAAARVGSGSRRGTQDALAPLQDDLRPPSAPAPRSRDPEGRTSSGVAETLPGLAGIAK